MSIHPLEITNPITCFLLEDISLSFATPVIISLLKTNTILVKLIPKEEIVPIKESHLETNQYTPEKPLINFFRARKIQLLRDLYRIDKYSGRAEKLLPEFSKDLDENVEITLKRIKNKINISTLPNQDISILSEAELFILGTDWQFLLDSDKKLWTPQTFNTLNFDEIHEEANILREKLKSGYFKRLNKSY